MEIDRSLLIRGGAVFLAALLLWGGIEAMPGRGLARCQDRLLEAAGRRHWDKARKLMAEDYRDQWGQDREQAIALAAEGLQNFLTLEVTPEDSFVEREGREAVISARLRLSGRGNALGEALMERANSLESHFRFAWSRKSWKPWDWKLVSVSQNEIDTLWTP
jgi:hypothetical protein